MNIILIWYLNQKLEKTECYKRIFLYFILQNIILKIQEMQMTIEKRDST